MGCNCGKSASGATIVWEWHAPDGVKTFSSQDQANAARARAGGAGPIIRISQPGK